MRKILVTIAATLCLSTAALAEETGSKDVPAADTVPPKAELATPPKAETVTPPKADLATPPNYRHANWIGGHGASWQTGRHSYGFEGFFAGCHYSGHAGRHGYHLDKVC